MSRPRFRAGQLVETFGLPQAYANGLRFTIEGEPIKTQRGWYWYTVLTMNGLLTNCTFSEANLRPIYDGDAPGHWDECMWRPRRSMA